MIILRYYLLCFLYLNGRDLMQSTHGCLYSIHVLCPVLSIISQKLSDLLNKSSFAHFLIVFNGSCLNYLLYSLSCNLRLKMKKNDNIYTNKADRHKLHAS